MLSAAMSISTMESVATGVTILESSVQLMLKQENCVINFYYIRQWQSFTYTSFSMWFFEDQKS